MDGGETYGACSPSLIPAAIKCFFSSRTLGSLKDMEPDVLKLLDLASPSRKNQVLVWATVVEVQGME